MLAYMGVTFATSAPDTASLIPAAYGEDTMLLANVKLKLNLRPMPLLANVKLKLNLRPMPMLLSTTAVLDIPVLDILVSLIPAAYSADTMLLANVKLKLHLKPMPMLSTTPAIPASMVSATIPMLPAHMLVSMGMALVLCTASRFLTVIRLLLLARNCHWILYKASSIPTLLWLARGVFCHCTNVTNIYLFVLS